MRPVSTVRSLVSLALVAALAVGCGGDRSEDVPEGPLAPFVREVAGILRQVDEARLDLDDQAVEALPSADREARYSELEEQSRNGLDRLLELAVPLGAGETVAHLADMLVNEREMWLHMVFYARTGQVVHRALADDFAFTVQEDRLEAMVELTNLLAEAEIDAASLGLEVVATPTAVVRATSTPTPLPTQTATPTRSPVPTPTPSPRSTSTAAASATTVPPTGTPTAVPRATATPPPSATPQPTRTPTPTPSPTSTPTPAPVMLEGSLTVIEYPDRKGNPARIAHWIVGVPAGVVGIVEYPFLADDRLEISVYGGRIALTYMDAPDGARLVELRHLQKAWNGEATSTVDGDYGFYFDNTGGDEEMEMHLLITYHEYAPGSVTPQ